jgi:hypothetical protein
MGSRIPGFMGLLVYGFTVHGFTGLWVYRVTGPYGVTGPLANRFTGLRVYRLMDLRVYGFIVLHPCTPLWFHITSQRMGEGRPRVYAKSLIRISAEVPHAASGSKSPGLCEALNWCQYRQNPTPHRSAFFLRY